MKSSQSLYTALLVVAALALGTTINDILPNRGSVWNEPVERTAAIGERFDVRGFSAMVTSVGAAPEAATRFSVAGSSGLWLVADLEISASTEPAHAFAYVEAANGRRYNSAGALRTTCRETQPGITSTCHLAFEMPESALEGATLIVPSSPNTVDVHDLRVRVDLGITSEQVSQWKAAKKPIRVSDSGPKES